MLIIRNLKEIISARRLIISKNRDLKILRQTRMKRQSKGDEYSMFIKIFTLVAKGLKECTKRVCHKLTSSLIGWRLKTCKR
jgi:hypothetical protein